MPPAAESYYSRLGQMARTWAPGAARVAQDTAAKSYGGNVSAKIVRSPFEDELKRMFGRKVLKTVSNKGSGRLKDVATKHLAAAHKASMGTRMGSSALNAYLLAMAAGGAKEVGQAYGDPESYSKDVQKTWDESSSDPYLKGVGKTLVNPQRFMRQIATSPAKAYEAANQEQEYSAVPTRTMATARNKVLAGEMTPRQYIDYAKRMGQTVGAGDADAGQRFSAEQIKILRDRMIR